MPRRPGHLSARPATAARDEAVRACALRLAVAGVPPIHRVIAAELGLDRSTVSSAIAFMILADAWPFPRMPPGCRTGHREGLGPAPRNYCPTPAEIAAACRAIRAAKYGAGREDDPFRCEPDPWEVPGSRYASEYEREFLTMRTEEWGV